MHQEDQPIPASLTSAELIARAQRGEESAFEMLYQSHKKRVYGLCLRMIGNTAEAEELMQEVFLLVFRKIQTFRGDSAFSTWLYRLAANVVLMRLRKKRVSETPLENNERAEEFDQAPKQFGAPDLAMIGTIDRLNLECAIAQLPHGYKQVFVLHDVEGYEHHEVAALLGVSIGNSKSQLHKARMKLRRLLHEADADRESRVQEELHLELA